MSNKRYFVLYTGLEQDHVNFSLQQSDLSIYVTIMSQDPSVVKNPGPEEFEYLKKLGPDFDAILLEHDTGYALAEHLHKIYRDITVVVSNGALSPEEMAPYQELGITRFTKRLETADYVRNMLIGPSDSH